MKSDASKSFAPRWIPVAVLMLIGLWAIGHYQSSANAEPKIIFPKGSTYEKEWKRVDSLSGEGLYKSALDLTNEIYKKAKKENNTEQTVKSLMYRFRLSQTFQENSEEKAIYDLQAELKTAKFPLKQVVHSMLADLYWQYYAVNRWTFESRSTTVNFKNDSINTWDLKHLVAQTIYHYNASLSSADSLKRVDDNVLDAVLEKGNAPKHLRPTLFDFLAHRAVDFFVSDEPAITRPAETFHVDKPEYFATSPVFSKMQLNSPDSMAFKFYALQLLQQLEQLHAGDTSADAIADVVLKRMKLVYGASVHPNKDTLYYEGLEYIVKTFSASVISGEALYEIANMHASRASKYTPETAEQYKWDYRAALGFCDEIIRKYPESTGAKKAAILKNSITRSTFSFTTENPVDSQKPSRALISWKNTTKLYFRVVKIEEEMHSRYTYESYEDQLKNYLRKDVLSSWQTDLPDDKDFQHHSVEIKIPELNNGHYAIIASKDPSFKPDTNLVAFNTLWVTNIAYLQRPLDDGSMQYVVMNRQTGEPMQGVDVQMWNEVYDYGPREYVLKKGEKFTTDKDGLFIVAPTSNYRTMIAEFKAKNDHYYSDYAYQYRRYKTETKKYNKTFFFTDRSIYRPGQTVYFKGIIIETDGKTNTILKNKSTKVTFYDVNYQKVAALDLTTNEYGSFAGTFTAPSSGLTGQMHIANESGNQYFSVEEYKRPKFEVLMHPVKGAYRLNDSVKVTGTARNYNGAPTDQATVKYRVVRTASFPWWWYCWRGYYPNSETVEIINGTVTSNDTGGFVIPFKAIPDLTVPAESKPTFNYEVYVDVTDITGETHSTTAYVNVGYTALDLNVQIGEERNKTKKDSVNISLVNLSGQEEEGIVSVKIWKLNAPSRLIRSRQWSKPDKFIYTKEQWNSMFPDDPWKDEDEMLKWSKGEQVYAGDVNTKKNTRFYPSDSKWSSGYYVLEAFTKDKYGEEVKDVRYFKLYSPEDKAPSVPVHLSYKTEMNSVKPGENFEFTLGTTGKNVFVLYEVELQNKIISRQWMKLCEEYKTIKIPVKAEHRNGLGIHIASVLNNRGEHYDRAVYVEKDPVNIDITLETFRNKLLPGQDEEWKFKVKGPKGEKVAAEMLASMYDASLDQFRGHYWSFYLSSVYYGISYTTMRIAGTSGSMLVDKIPQPVIIYSERTYNYLNWFGYSYGYRGWYYNTRGAYDVTLSESVPAAAPMEGDEEKITVTGNGQGAAPGKDADKKAEAPMSKNNKLADSIMLEDQNGNAEKPATGATQQLSEVKARSDLNETVFFFPQLETDSSGAVVIKFKMNEALTRWKLMLFAHTKDLRYTQVTKEVITQKDLMIMPFVPRFLRQGDQVTITAKVSNLSDQEQNGKAQLMLFDAISMKPVDVETGNTKSEVPFSAKKGQSALVSWDIKIPDGIDALQYKVVAASGKFSDGEEAALPILSNRMLVTETMPMPVRGGQNKVFRFEKLITGQTSTMRNHKLTFEFTSNPAWYAVQALPYMMEYPHECAEQTFSRYYANTIASHIANSTPKIKKVFDAWKNTSPDAFLSNLEKNQELKNVVMEETPWVLQAKDESERKKRVALLFDLNKMANEQNRALRKLKQMQLSNGGWTWFPGMPDDRYMTQHIITGFGHLDHLGVKDVREDQSVWSMVQSGVQYLDARIREDYDWILKFDKGNKDKNHLSYIAIQYLYARSYFKDLKMNPANKEAHDYFMGQAKKYWTSQSRYMQGMLALAMHRNGETTSANAIMKSLKETAIVSEELGMYWKDMSAGYYWYQAPTETQALLVEAFDEVAQDRKAVDDIRVWLIKNKQTNDWKTTKATTEACYALLLRGTDWLATESDVTIMVGNQIIDPKKSDIKEEPGTGYFKTSWSGKEITPDMGVVKISKPGPGVSWGAMYWQYFEDLDKITPAQTPLRLSKKLFREKNTSAGPVIEPVTENTVLRPGDKIKVRIELRSDRDMEYVHMKDMRAAGFEPVNVLSQYKWNGGLGYYESTRDASTNFFFHWLPKGTHVFEYPLVVSHAGSFSNGITTIQCMYAPEFSAHSEGIRVQVKKQ
ncbi:MAG: alpha-2-macroglobulin family protein [Bacteroidia bacterium]